METAKATATATRAHDHFLCEDHYQLIVYAQAVGQWQQPVAFRVAMVNRYCDFCAPQRLTDAVMQTSDCSLTCDPMTRQQKG